MTFAQRMFFLVISKAKNDAFTGREVVAGMLKSGSCVIATLERDAREGWGSCRFASFSVLVVKSCFKD